MKSTCKRLISFLLMMVLLLGMPFSVMATDTEEPTEGETLPESWQIISDSLPDAVEGVDPLDPDNPYPYGEPVDNFFPEGLLEPDPYLSAIEEESVRLSSMATNVLSLTKVENQTILSDVSAYNLSEQIRSCILLLENKWSKKDIELQLDFGEHMISANEELLKQVWLNLLDNAVKFTPDGHTVRVQIAETDSGVTVDVLNTGSEIPPESQDKIFNKFYQADESHATQGNGIGLAIVKRIVDLHGGSVMVSSENDVTVFSVEIPQTNKKG